MEELLREERGQERHSLSDFDVKLLHLLLHEMLSVQHHFHFLLQTQTVKSSHHEGSFNYHYYPTLLDQRYVKVIHFHIVSVSLIIWLHLNEH